nr:hypothetical protein [Methanobacterium formicicum]
MSKDEQRILKELNSRMKEFRAALKDEKKKTGPSRQHPRIPNPYPF